VTFDVQGHGKAPAAQTIEEGGKANKPGNPSADDYKFGGWYTDAGCTEAFDFNQTIAADITLYAKWTKKTVSREIPFILASESLLTFNLDGGVLNGETDVYMMIVLDDTVITLPRPYKPGYTFAYWEGSRFHRKVVEGQLLPVCVSLSVYIPLPGYLLLSVRVSLPGYLRLPIHVSLPDGIPLSVCVPGDRALSVCASLPDGEAVHPALQAL